MKEEPTDPNKPMDEQATSQKKAESTPADIGERIDDAPILFAYLRRQAIDDGVLVDLSFRAAETGFVIPVACTAAVWHGYIVPAGSFTNAGQSERGRGHDLLWMLYCAIKRLPAGKDRGRLAFDVIFLMPPAVHQTVRLVAVCGPDDGGEPVLTVMLPHED